MGKKNPIKSMKTTNKTAILIVVFFMLITFIIFQCTYTGSKKIFLWWTNKSKLRF